MNQTLKIVLVAAGVIITALVIFLIVKKLAMPKKSEQR